MSEDNTTPEVPSTAVFFQAPQPVATQAPRSRRASAPAGPPSAVEAPAADAAAAPKAARKKPAAKATTTKAAGTKTAAAKKATPKTPDAVGGEDLSNQSSAAPVREANASGDFGDNGEGGEGGEAAARRRRRRGGRGRGKKTTGPRPEGAEGDDFADAEGADGSDEAPASGDDEDGDGDGGSRKRRRSRGSRSGSGSGSSGGSGPSDDQLQGSTRLQAKRQRRRDSRDGQRRRPVISEAEFLARRESVKRSMVVREKDGRVQIAVLEDDVLVEHYVSHQAQQSMAGNVYLGRVQNVLPGMEAAFVDVGRGRNAVLYAGEVNWTRRAWRASRAESNSRSSLATP